MPGSRSFRRALAVVAGLYFVGIFLEAAGAPIYKVVPRPVLYFLQVAKLFPHAVDVVTEDRAEAYSCGDKTWKELDVRPFFPLRANDKENRFQRAMFFYRHEAKVMHALDDYLVASNNKVNPPIGGVLFLSLRIPIPPPGTAQVPYQRKPLSEYPPDVRKYWYRTPTALRRARCHEEDEHGPAGP
jgi:hypothetical protein